MEVLKAGLFEVSILSIRRWFEFTHSTYPQILILIDRLFLLKIKKDDNGKCVSLSM